MKYKWDFKKSFNYSYIKHKLEKLRKKKEADSNQSVWLQSVLQYFGEISSDAAAEFQVPLAYLKRKKKFYVFPYPFIEKYDPEKIEVFVDDVSGFPYVIHNRHRLYFKKGTPLRHVQKKYSFLLLEQDISSPHRYLTPEYDVIADDVVVDLGVAEGNFALDVVEKVKYLYLFECDKEWIEALKLTFAPWKHKVCIVNKYVSNIDEDDFVSIDAFFERCDHKPTFFKVDIEGFENKFLEGGERTIINNQSHVVICTYHKPGDFASLSSWFTDRKYEVTPSEGYMLFPGEEQYFVAPFFRKGLIRCGVPNVSR